MQFAIREPQSGILYLSVLYTECRTAEAYGEGRPSERAIWYSLTTIWCCIPSAAPRWPIAKAVALISSIRSLRHESWCTHMYNSYDGAVKAL